MRKFTLFLVMLFMFSSLFVFGESPYVFIVNGDSIADDGSICINHDNQELVTVSYITEAIRQDGNTQHISATWESVGDVTIVETSGNSATIRSTDLAKGVIRLKYNREGCGVFVKNLHVYKSFSPSLYGLEIEGPDCLTPGEVVVYSVRPALTRNLNAYIGVDNYYWNLTDSLNKPSFVDRIVYAAGDGSSVTFIAGTVHVGDEIQVNFGQCNIEASKAVRKSVGKIPPAPIVESQTLCVPYGNGVRKVIKVETALDGVEYTCSVPSQFSSRKLNDSVFEIGFDKLSADDIKIRASYVGEEACGSSETTIHVVRTWGSNVELVYSGGSQCCAVIGQGSYKFIVQGDIPTNSEFYWQLPRGWVKDESISEGQSISIYPTRDALPVDTLKVWGDACNNEDVIIKSIPVYVCPATVDYIEHPACITLGDSVIFRVRLNNDGVTPTAYRWTTSDGLDLSQFVGDSVVFVPLSVSQYVCVTPVGEICEGVTYVDTLSFAPIAPDAILSTGCIAYNMPDTVTFRVASPTQNQHYVWEYPENWEVVSTHPDGVEIDLRTSGYSGVYEVGAYALGDDICGNSTIRVDSFVIDETSINIRYDAEAGIFSLTPRNIGNIHWYLVQNGQYVGDDMFQPSNTRSPELLDPYYDLVGDIFNDPIHCSMTDYSIVVEYTTSTGCKGRFVQGYPLDPDVDYLGNSYSYRAPSRVSAKSQTNQLFITPNPSKSNVEISLLDGNLFEVLILSIDGDLVYRTSEKQKTHSINISNLLSGNYIVVAVRNGKKVASSKLIKQ